MNLVDSHCHLDCLDLSNDEHDLTRILERAYENDVKHFLCVCITQSDFPKMQALTQAYDNVYLSVGTHPNEELAEEPTIESMIAITKNPKVVAIGETGLDYFRSCGDLTWQQNRFRQHITVAKRTEKPLIVHTRDAREDTIRILKEENAAQVGGVLHCFTENWAMAKAAMDLNFYISFSGIITFPNAKELREVAAQVPLDRILIETDSPYLAPIPFRGKPNEPSYVRYVAEKLAEIRGEPIEKIAEQTSSNFFSLFKISHP